MSSSLVTYNNAIKSRNMYTELMKSAKTPIHKKMIQEHLDALRLEIKNHVKEFNRNNKNFRSY